MAPSLPFTKSSKISASSLFGRKKRASQSSNPKDGAASTSATSVTNENEQPLIPDWKKIQQNQSQPSIGGATPSPSTAPNANGTFDWNKLEEHAEVVYGRKRSSVIQPGFPPGAAGGDSPSASQQQLPSALRADNSALSAGSAAENRRSSIINGVSFAAREPNDERIIPSRNTPAYLREQEYSSHVGLVNRQNFRFDADGPLQAMHENSISAVAIVHKTLSTTTLKDEKQQQLEALTPETVPLREYNSSTVPPHSPTPRSPVPVRASSTLDPQRAPSTEMRISTAIEHRSSSYVEGEEPATRWSLRMVDADIPTLRATNSTSITELAKKPTASRDSGINDPTKARPTSLQIPEKSRSGKNSNSSSTHALPDTTASGPTVTYMMNEPRGSSENAARSSSPQQHRQHKHKKGMATSSGGTSTAAEGLQTEDIGLVSDGTGIDSPAAKKYRTLAPSTHLRPADAAAITDTQQTSNADATSTDSRHGISTSPLRPVKSNYSATAIANDRIKESIMALYVDRQPSRQQMTGGEERGRINDVGFVVRNDDDETEQEHDATMNAGRELGADPSHQHLRSTDNNTTTRPGTATSRKPSSNLFRSPSITRSAPHAPTSTVVPAAEEDDVNNDVNSSPPEPAPRHSRTNTNGAAEQRLSTAWAADSIRRIFSSSRESQEHEEAVPTDNLAAQQRLKQLQSQESLGAARGSPKPGSANRSRERLAERQTQSQPQLRKTTKEIDDASSLSNLSLNSTQEDVARNEQNPASRNKSRSRSDGAEEVAQQQFSSANNSQSRSNIEASQEPQQVQKPARGLGPTNSSASSFRTTESDMGKRYATALLNDCPKEFRPIEAEYVVQRFVRDEDLMQQAVQNGATESAITKSQQSRAALSPAGSHHTQASSKSNRSGNVAPTAAGGRAPAITTTPASNIQLQQQASLAATATTTTGNGGQPVYLAGSSAQRLNNLDHASTVSNGGSTAVTNGLDTLERRGSKAGSSGGGTGAMASNRTNMSYASSSTLGISTANGPTTAGAAAAASGVVSATHTEDEADDDGRGSVIRDGVLLQNQQQYERHVNGSRQSGRLSGNDRGSRSGGDRQRAPSFGIDPSRDMLALDADVDDTNTITNTNHDDQSYADETEIDDGTATGTEADEYDEEVLRTLADARQISVARFPRPVVAGGQSKSAVRVQPLELQSSFIADTLQPNNPLQTSLSHASSGGAFRDMQLQQQQNRPLSNAQMLAAMASANPSDLQLERLNELVNANQTLSDAQVNELVMAASLAASSHASAQHQQQQQQQHRLQQRTSRSAAGSAVSGQTQLIAGTGVIMSNKSSRNDINMSQHPQQQLQNYASQEPLASGNLIVPPPSRRTAASSPAKSSVNMSSSVVDPPQHRSLTNIKTTKSASDARRVLSQSPSKQQQQLAQMSPSQQQLLLYHTTTSQQSTRNHAQQQIDIDTGQVAAITDDDHEGDNVIAFKEVGSGDFNQMIENLHQAQVQQLQRNNSSLAKTRMQSISNASASTAAPSPRSGRSKASFRVGGTNSHSNVRSVASTDANQNSRSEHVLPTTSTSRQRMVTDKMLSQQRLPIVHTAASEHMRGERTGGGAQSGILQPMRAATAPRLTQNPSRVGFHDQPATTAPSHVVSSSRPQVQRSLSNNMHQHEQQQQHDDDDVDEQLQHYENNIPTITNAKRLSDSDESIEFESKQSRTLLGVLDARRRADYVEQNHDVNLLAPSRSTAEPTHPSSINADVTSSTVKAVSSAEHARRVLASSAMLRPPGLLRTNHTFDEQLNMLHDLHSISPTENVVSHAILEHANANATFGSRIYPQPKNRVPYEALQLSTIGALTRLVETGTGGEIFLLGVERFNEQNVSDVRDLIEQTQPDIVFVQLGADIASARSRRSVTTVHDPSGQTVSELYVKEATPPWLPGSWDSVIRPVFERHGFINGLLHILYLDLESSYRRQHLQSAQLAFREAVTLGDSAPFCDVVFGDRATDVTFCRAYSTLNIFEKFYLMARLVFAHMHGDSYAALTSLSKMRRVLVDERDKFMCASLQYYAQSLIRTSEGMRPLTVVAVVGAEHVKGIKHYWRHQLDVRPLQALPATPYGADEVVLRKVASWTPWVVLGAVGLYAGYKSLKYGVPLIRDFYSSFAPKM